jgi:hypothetical protein
MKNKILSNSFLKQILNFANFYHEHRIKVDQLISFKYRIITTFEEFKKTNLIQLSFTDNPGDLLAPISIETIKSTPDLIAGMHPIDVNTINDLYYLQKDHIAEIRVNKESIMALYRDGRSIQYDISDNIDPDSLKSTRLAYMIGHMTAEKLMREAYLVKDNFKILSDNIATLEILDIDSNRSFLKNPLDILFSDDYKKFSKEDVSRIGFICGQMTKLS